MATCSPRSLAIDSGDPPLATERIEHDRSGRMIGLADHFEGVFDRISSTKPRIPSPAWTPIDRPTSSSSRCSGAQVVVGHTARGSPVDHVHRPRWLPPAPCGAGALVEPLERGPGRLFRTSLSDRSWSARRGFDHRPRVGSLSRSRQPPSGRRCRRATTRSPCIRPCPHYLLQDRNRPNGAWKQATQKAARRVSRMMLQIPTISLTRCRATQQRALSNDSRFFVRDSFGTFVVLF